MAIKIKDNNQYRNLTDKEIKKETMLLLGLDPANPDDQKIYRRNYDIIRKRVKNYNTLLENKDNQLKANEVFLRIQRRKLAGQELTAEQQNILNTSSTNTGTYKKRIELNPELKLQSAFRNLENQYKGLLEKSSYVKEEYNKWLNKIISLKYINITTGEYITKSEALKLKKTEYFIEEVTRRERITVSELKNKLNSLAASLHAKQEKEYQKNKAKYHYNRKEVGTP